MRLPRSLWLPRVGAWLLPVLLFGCVAPTAERALLERAGKERSCGADKLTVTYLGASAYRVEGCGPPETFICVSVSYQDWVCTKEGGTSSRRVLGTVTALAARRASEARQDVAQPPPPVPALEPVPYSPPPPPAPLPPPTF